ASVDLQSCLVTIGFGYPFLSLLLVRVYREPVLDSPRGLELEAD
ncbi:hypothetical protein CK203_100017, partial [Vitis vinifera]